MLESIHRSRVPGDYSYGFLDPNCGAIRTNRGLPCRPGMASPPTYPDGLIQETHLDVPIQKRSAEPLA